LRMEGASLPTVHNTKAALKRPQSKRYRDSQGLLRYENRGGRVLFAVVSQGH
jgi:hypothetical protein